MHRTCPEGHGDEGPQAGDGVDRQSVDQEPHRHDDQQQEPEPEEQEELLVHDVVRKNANGLDNLIVMFDGMNGEDSSHLGGSPPPLPYSITRIVTYYVGLSSLGLWGCNFF